MILLTPQEIEKLKETNKKLQGLRLNGGPIDDIGPLNISIEKDSLETLEKTKEEIANLCGISFLEKERENENSKSD